MRAWPRRPGSRWAGISREEPGQGAQAQGELGYLGESLAKAPRLKVSWDIWVRAWPRRPGLRWAGISGGEPGQGAQAQGELGYLGESLANAPRLKVSWDISGRAWPRRPGSRWAGISWGEPGQDAQAQGELRYLGESVAMAPMKLFLGSFFSLLDGLGKAKKPFHFTVPLKSCQGFHVQGKEGYLP